ncbi:hypothetical protein [Streptomyces cylindrosporus]|uniref:Uncharacterized protein n=1 Tax=Streptomyces cylindrosporus TaxID=2927583 RepID=A0ABS9YK14_9ACTN|nr:hypothetical protein [Streptomyces cylindrosporus]MCI3277563.1 hypothetical protein [Streptomyces cylindrosporus]
MTLIELAVAAHAEYEAEAPRQLAEIAEETRAEFLCFARGSAKAVLGEEFEELKWQYSTGPDLPDETEEATAHLEPGRPEYLRYRIDHSKEKTEVRLELVQPCSSCRRDRITRIDSLITLGQLLAEGGEER